MWTRIAVLVLSGDYGAYEGLRSQRMCFLCLR